MDRVFRTRIGRLLVEDHFVAFVDHGMTESGTSQPVSNGIVTEIKLAVLIQEAAKSVQCLADEIYGYSTKVNITDASDATVHSIPNYLLFIFKEVLKNAVKATIEKHPFGRSAVQVTIVTGTYDVQVKIADRGGGMPRDVLQNVWRYGFSGFSESHDHPEVAGIATGIQMDVTNEMSGFGVGLPLSRLYARYLGGDLQISQVLGHGCEVSIVLSQRGMSEDIDLGGGSNDGSPGGGFRSRLMAPL